MDRKTENEIAQFFQKRVRERILYLMNSKKRGDIFDKLAHNAEDYLDCALTVEKSERPLDKDTIGKYLGKTVYVMECHGEYRSPLDGSFAKLDAALDTLWSCGIPYILYGNSCLYVETEYDFTTHAAYLLKRNDKP